MALIGLKVANVKQVFSDVARTCFEIAVDDRSSLLGRLDDASVHFGFGGASDMWLRGLRRSCGLDFQTLQSRVHDRAIGAAIEIFNALTTAARV